MPVGVFNVFRVKTDGVLEHGIQGRFGQCRHIYVPLLGKLRLDDGIGAFGAADMVGVIFNFYDVACFFQRRDDGFPGGKPVHADIKLGGLTHGPIVVEYINDFQVVP